MQTKFVKWGNSLTLRIPSAFAKEIGAVKGTPADMTVKDGALIIKVTKQRRKRVQR